MSLNLHQSFREEFAEFKDDIERLYAADEGFRSILNEYRELDEVIMKIEQNVSPAGDLETAELKRKRLTIKDQLFAKLQEAKH